jgi:serine/threonine-protein kinase RsbW
VVAERCAVCLDDGVIPTIRLTGELQWEASAAIAEAFHKVIARRCEQLHLDAAGITEVDEGGRDALLSQVRAAEAQGVTVKLTHASRRFQEAFRQREPNDGEDAPASAGDWECDLVLPCAPRSVSLMRGCVAKLAVRLPFSTTEVEDIVLAVGEAAANAVRHGTRTGSSGPVHLRCRVDGGGLAVEITDPGDGFDPERLRRPNPRAQRAGGMGIYLMRRIMDEVTYTFDSRGTTVRLVKHGPSP